MKFIKRTKYLELLKLIKNTQDIKIITGIRRAGKTNLMFSFLEWIKSTEDNANIVSLNLQDQENEKYLEYHELHDYIMQKYNPQMKNYLFIDEVQLCKNFEKTLISIHSKNIYDIYVSGSNAFLLSSDLRTLFSGRTYSFEVFPFSFKEYIEYYPNNNIFNAFTRYVLQGGFASTYQYQSTDVVYNYIRNDIFENVVYKDILEKYKIRNNIVFKNIVNFLIDNISNLTSLRSIENFLKSSGYSPSHNTIGTYINYLLNAFAFYEAKRYDIKGKKYLSTEQKYYLADHSIKYAMLGTKELDTGRVLENIVFMELKRRNYEVYVGVLPNKEVDFIAVKPNIKLYIQVAAFVDNPETLKRETAPFYEIKDNYPKIIIARTYQEEYSIDGIKIIDIANWLLS